MGWKISDLVFFPLKTRKVVAKPPSEKGDSSCPPGECSEPCQFKAPVEVAISTCWEILTKGVDRSSSGPLPVNSDPKLLSLEDLLRKGAYKLKIKKGIRKKDLFRFLLAKMLYEREEGLHLDEFLVLWELYLQLLEVQSKDPSFREKYGTFFRNSFIFFRELGSQKEFPIRIEEVGNLQYLERIASVLEPMLPTRSAYFGLKGQKNLKSGFSLVFESELLSRKIPEGRRIGVGYRDKGSRRDQAFDGSPDWREVASSLQEKRIVEVENFLGVIRESPDFDWDLVYNTSKVLEDVEDLEENISFPDPEHLDPQDIP
jgi:hypothetical protein